MNTDNLWIFLIIVAFIIWGWIGDKKKVDEGKGDEESSKVMWGEGAGTPISHKEDYESGKWTIGITIAVFIFAYFFL